MRAGRIPRRHPCSPGVCARGPPVLFVLFSQYYGPLADARHLEELGLEIVDRREGRPFKEAPPSGYNNPAQLRSAFESLATSYPTLATLIDLTETYDQPVTHDGNHLYALKISDNVDVDEDEPNYLVVGNHHARELITPELALNTSATLLSQYASDDAIRALVDSTQIYVMWTVNPDGLDYVWEVDDYWRKNRRNNGNSYGVDLNRNGPIGWDFSCGGSSTPASDTYRGPSAASEPETQTVLAFHEDRRFAKVLDFHSYAREVRSIYADCASLPALVDAYFEEIADAFADLMTGYVGARSCCMGGHIHSAYHGQGALTFLVETGTAFQPPESAMREELRRVLPGTLYFLQLPIPLVGHVLDASTNAPLAARIDIADLDFELGERRETFAATGRYHLWLPAGTYNLTVTADGVGSSSAVVSITSSGTTVRDWYL